MQECLLLRNPIIELAERHVREREQRVLRQKQLIVQLELGGRGDTARSARELLATLQKLLDADKAHLDELVRSREATNAPNRCGQR